MPSPAERAVLDWARSASRRELDRALINAAAPGDRIETVMARRWLTLAALGALFARGAFDPTDDGPAG